MFLCVKGLESSLAFPKSLTNIGCVTGASELLLWVCRWWWGEREAAPCRAVCTMCWDGVLGCTSTALPWRSWRLGFAQALGLLGEDTWLCALPAPQPGIWDLEEKRECW